jgi:hypothetical protein
MSSAATIPRNWPCAQKIALANNLFGPGWSVWAGRTIACLKKEWRRGGTFILVRAPAAYYTNNYTHTLAANERTQAGRPGSFHFLFACPLTFAEGAEEGAPVKKARAPAQPGGEELPTKSSAAGHRPRAVHQEEEAEEDDDEDAPQESNVPAGFLSPSVLQALELGKAIPGA